ncbi:MAG: SpaA isopeptide-forming pilin-related protein [Arcanobacterium sp.]
MHAPHRFSLRGKIKKIVAAWTVTALALAGVIMVSTDIAAPTYAQADTHNSDDGDFTLTKQASASTVPWGGGDITYTYTIVNNTDGKQYFREFSDDKCPNLQMVSGVESEWNGWLFRRINYIPARGTAVYRCTQRITQTTTNTVTLEMGDKYSWWTWEGLSTATATELVTRDAPPSGFTCDDIWYSSNHSATYPGAIGTIDTSTGNVSPVANIAQQTGYNNLRGSAAMAVDPNNPRYIYFSPRQYTSSEAAWVYRYDIQDDESTLLNPSDTYYSDISTVRLAADADGILWTVSSGGVLYRMDPSAAPTTWESRGTVGRSNSSSNMGSLGSGDIAFDGNGTLFIIGATGSNGYLYSLSAEQLAAASTTNPPTATYVGHMGSGQYNGIAFDNAGNAYASTSSQICSLDVSTGTTSFCKSINGASVGDLGSCAIPRPELRVTKSVTGFVGPDGKPTVVAVEGGKVTWTIEIENIGSMAATNVEFVDTLQDATVTSTKLNGVEKGADYFNTAKPVNDPVSQEGIIAPGAKATIEITTEVPTGYLDSHQDALLCNQGTVTLTGEEGSILTDDPDTSELFDPTCVTISNPVIDVTKTATMACLPDNKLTHPVEFTITVLNPGSESITDVAVQDSMPNCTPTYDSGDTSGEGLLDPGEEWVYKCTVDLSVSEVTNTATVTGKSVVSEIQLSDTATYTVKSPELSITKDAATVAGDGIAAPGETITYTVTVVNDGPQGVTQQGISIVDTLPEGVDYVAGSMERTYWVTSGGTRTEVTDQPAVSMDAERKLTIFSASDGISLEPIDSANPDASEKITITFDATVSQEIDLATITSVTNTAVAVAEQTALECPVTASVENELRELYQFNVNKQGTNCDVGVPTCDLSGAEFALYGAADPQAATPVIADTPITGGITVDPGNGALFVSSQLREGTYWLVETKAPEGFVLLATPVQFTLDSNGVTLTDPSAHTGVISTLAGDENNLPTIVVKDTTPAPLPAAGGPGTTKTGLFGIGLIIAGWLGWFVTRRKLPSVVRD